MPDIKVHTKQWYAIAEKMTPNDIHQFLLKVCIDQTVDVSTVWW